jgi:hypothetical protein
MASFCGVQIDIPGCRRDSPRWCYGPTGEFVGGGRSIRSELRMEARAEQALRLFRVGPQTSESCPQRWRSPCSAKRPPGAVLPAAGSAGRGQSCWSIRFASGTPLGSGRR